EQEISRKAQAASHGSPRWAARRLLRPVGYCGPSAFNEEEAPGARSVLRGACRRRPAGRSAPRHGPGGAVLRARAGRGEALRGLSAAVVRGGARQTLPGGLLSPWPDRERSRLGIAREHRRGGRL